MGRAPSRVQNLVQRLGPEKKAARIEAEERIFSVKPDVVRVPSWLNDDAKKIFRKMVRDMRKLDLLSILDVGVLAIYSSALAEYAVTQDFGRRVHLARQILTSSDKLGANPQARVRLAKRVADNKPVDDLEKLFNDVTEFVNSNDG